MAEHKIFQMSFASVYPHYVTKAEKKGRSKAEVDEAICWLTGYSEAELATTLDDKRSFREFFDHAPDLNPARREITGVICGVRIEAIEEPLMQEIRYMDKLVDEIAKGRPMEKVLRQQA